MGLISANHCNLLPKMIILSNFGHLAQFYLLDMPPYTSNYDCPIQAAYLVHLGGLLGVKKALNRLFAGVN